MSDEPQKTAYDQLSPKQRKFVNHYVGHLNATRAGREAGYANPDEGRRLRRYPKVAAAIDELLEQDSMPKAEIRARLERDARFDLDEFMRVATGERIFWVRALEHEPVRELATRRGVTADALDAGDLAYELGADQVATTLDGTLMVRVATISQDVEVDWAALKEAGLLGAFKKIKRHKDGAIEYEVKDQHRALELLGKAQRMWVERQEHSGPDGEPLKLYANVDLEDV